MTMSRFDSHVAPLRVSIAVLLAARILIALFVMINSHSPSVNAIMLGTIIVVVICSILAGWMIGLLPHARHRRTAINRLKVTDVMVDFITISVLVTAVIVAFPSPGPPIVTYIVVAFTLIAAVSLFEAATMGEFIPAKRLAVLIYAPVGATVIWML